MHLSLVRLILVHLIVLIPLLFSSALCAEERTQTQTNIAIIANKQVGILTNSQVYRLFSLRQKLLPNNIPVRLVVQPLSQPITEHFTKQMFDLYPYQLKRMWDRQVFSGKAKSPKIIENEQELIQFIIGTPNALGYISYSSELLLKHQGDINVITVY